MGDSLSRYDKEIEEIFQIVSAPSRKCRPLTSRSVYPAIIARTACEQANKRKMPRGVHYDTINAVENRIVRTLANGAPPEAVAREMRSMGLSRISEWENVRTLAPLVVVVGSRRKEGPIKVAPASKDGLFKLLYQ
jgi:hypothetical protein